MPPLNDERDERETPAEGVPAQLEQPPPISLADIYLAIQGVGELAAKGVRITEDLGADLRPRMARVELRVFGSRPPPLLIYPPTKEGELALPSPRPSSPPLTERQTKSENAIENLAQQLSNFQGEVRQELRAQSRVMGLAPNDTEETGGKRTAKRVKRRQWLKDAIALMTLVVAAIGGVAALAAQRSAGTAAAAVTAPPPQPPAVLQP